MEALLATVLIVVFCVIVSFLSTKFDKKADPLLMRQAEKRNGKFEKSWLDNDQTVVFENKGDYIELSSGAGGSHRGYSYRYTRVVFNLRSLRNIVLDSGEHQKFFNVPDYKQQSTGDPEFDKQFKIRANDREFLERFLSPDIRGTLLDYKGRKSSVFFSLYKGRFVFGIAESLSSDGEYDELIKAGLALKEKLSDI